MKRIILYLSLLTAVTSFAITRVTLAWDPNPEPNIRGYVVRWGTSSNHFPFSANLDAVTSFIAPLPDTEGIIYYFVVSAFSEVDSGGFPIEGERSKVVSYTVPIKSPPKVPVSAPVKFRGESFP